jgi:hypothetical protein
MPETSSALADVDPFIFQFPAISLLRIDLSADLKGAQGYRG